MDNLGIKIYALDALLIQRQPSSGHVILPADQSADLSDRGIGDHETVAGAAAPD